MRRRSWVALLVSIPLLVLGLPAPPAAAITQPNQITYVYDDLGRLEATIDPSATNGIARYTYDARGNLLSIARQSTAATSIVDFHGKTGSAGSSVTIYGAGFSSTPGQNTVRFNGTTATVTSTTVTQLVAAVPPGATTGTISVTSPSGSATSTQTYVVVGSQVPTITGFSPASGIPGTSVTITGTNFDPAAPAANNVFFNGLRAKVTSASASTLTAVVPPLRSSGRITVQTRKGQATSSADFFVPPSSYTVADVQTTGRLVLGQSAPVTISTSGKVGLRVFDANVGQDGFVSISSTIPLVSVTLYDVFGRSIASTSVATSGGYLDPGALPATGTYTLLIDPSGTNTGTVTLTAYLSDEISGTVTPTQAGSQVTASISTPGQNASYTFSGSAGQRVSVKISNSTNMVMTVSIKKPDGTTLTSKLFGGSDFIDATALPVDGTYTIVVDPSGSATGSITLTVYDVPPDITGTVIPNQTGSQVTASISTPGQNASYTFSGSAGQRVSVKITNSTNMVMTVSIKKPDGTTLTSKLFGGSDFIEPAALPVDGTYTIVVDPSGSATGSVTLTVYDVPPDPSGTITIDGPAVTVTISAPGQNASYTFAGSVNKHIALSIANSTNGYVTVRIKKPDGVNLASTTVTGATGSITATLPVAGTYTIVVDPNTTATGSVTLTLTDPPAGAIETKPVDRAAAQGPQSRSTEPSAPGRSPGGRTKPSAPPDDGFPTAADVEGFQPSGVEQWVPGPDQLAGWTSGRPDSPFTSVPALQALPGETALAGQVLTLNEIPLSGVTLRIGGAEATTDVTGRFLLTKIPWGHDELLIDGTTASTDGSTYGLFQVKVDLRKGETNVLDYTIWMPRLDLEHAVHIDSPTRSEVVVTNPSIPGLELHIPRGSVIKDIDGNLVHELSITPIPVDRPPFPLPAGVEVPVYFTIQPGGATVLPEGAWLVYPNYRRLAPGTRVDFWYYEPDEEGWEVYGEGTVTQDGSQIVPDSGVRIHEFAGAMINTGLVPALLDVLCNVVGGDCSGDPIDPATGLFAYRKTDLALPGPMPIELTRVYRPRDTNRYAFGLGMAMTYEMYLYSANQYQEADLILPGERRIHYVRTSPGTTFSDAVFEAQTNPGPFFRSIIVWNGNGWNLVRRDGTVYVFGENAPLQQIRDRFGNRIVLIRQGGPGGLITQIASSSGRWVSLTYTGSRVTEATDNLGRRVTYAYDGSGRMTSVTDPNQSTQPNPSSTVYGWTTVAACNPTSVMTSVTDPRGITFLTNTYDAGCRVTDQVVPASNPNQEFHFDYTVDGQGKVTRTDITDPNENVTRVNFDADGYSTSQTSALGTPKERTFTYERASGTHFLNAVVDGFHARRTEYTYNGFGQVASVTKLAGTPQAVRTQYTYEPVFKQLDTITDPLNHVTDFGYDAKGCLDTITDGAMRTTSFDCNSAGQITSVTDARNKTTTFAYSNGDLKTVTDPLGRASSRFTDAGGRVTAVTDPLNYVTRYNYDNLNQLTKVTDAAGRDVALEYDEDGNLRFVRDQRGASESTTQFTYNDQNLVQARTDPLGGSESFIYDDNGNLLTWTDRKNQATEYRYDPFDRVMFAGFNRTGSPPYTYASTIDYTYDVGGRLTSIADSTSGAGTITRGYDDLDRLTSEIQPNAPSPGVLYTYRADGTRQTMTVPGQSQVTYGYNNAGQVTSLTQGTTAVSMDYFADGRLQTLTLKPSPTPVVQSYAYDDAGELSSITYSHGASTDDLTYGYDPAGRRMAVYGTYGRTSLPTATTANAVYDLANRLTSWNGATAVHDNNGNLTNDGTFTYTYNARNQVTGVSQGQTTLGAFVYDGLGRRVSRTVSGATTKPAYDGWNLVQERDGSGTVTADYLTGLGLDQPFVRTAGGATAYYLSDALGSIVGLADQTGAVPTSYTYEPYGKTTVSGTANASLLGFTGRENDSTGTLSLYNFRARAYSPTLQRFLGEDPISLLGGTANLYEYVESAPVDGVDPLGLGREGQCGFGCQLLGAIGIVALGVSIAATGFAIFAPASFVLAALAIGGALVSLGIRGYLGAPAEELKIGAMQVGISFAAVAAGAVLAIAGAPVGVLVGIALLVYALTVTINYVPDTNRE
jgi:RHS repeat-associated protein